MRFIVKLSTESYNSIQMDYDALAHILPLSPSNWNQHHVARWLQFVHLEPLISSFTKHHLNGSQLLTITPQHLYQLGVTNSIIQRKLMRWIREGFAQFDAHLMLANDNKENVAPNQNIMPSFGKELQMQRKHTTERQVKAGRRAMSMHNEDEGMVIRSCDGNLAAFYIMRQSPLKIGRGNTNTVRSLQVSVEGEHAEVMRVGNKYYLRDNGTEAGTFIKTESPKVLNPGALVEMGSFLLQVRFADLSQRLLQIGVTHMGTKQTGQLTITLQDGCNSFNFGRRKTNNFAFDDEHLSGLHARIFLLHGQFVIEDLHSTNGTWLRLSKPFEPSGSFLLENGCTFKVGTTITYTCECSRGQEKMRMEEQYDDICVSCGKQKRNVVLLPCRHNLLCFGCALHLQKCPMCISQIHQKIKIYL